MTTPITSTAALPSRDTARMRTAWSLAMLAAAVTLLHPDPAFAALPAWAQEVGRFIGDATDAVRYIALSCGPIALILALAAGYKGSPQTQKIVTVCGIIFTIGLVAQIATWLKPSI